MDFTCDGDEHDEYEYHRVEETSTDEEFAREFKLMLSKRQKRKHDDISENVVAKRAANTIETPIKHVVIFASEGSGILLGNLSSIALARDVHKRIGDVDQIRKLEKGDIVIHCKTEAQLQKALLVNTLCDIRVHGQVPKSLCESRGVIYNIDFDVSMDEIMIELKDQKVKSAKRLFRGKEKETTKSVMLTFSTPILPERVSMYYQSFRVRQFIPPALRCFKCQRFGHVAAKCKSKSMVCARCSGEHSIDNCTAEFKCNNCGGDHSAAYKGCPKYKEAVDVQRIRVENKISYAEAARKVKVNKHTPSYSAVVQNAPSQQARVKVVPNQPSSLQQSPVKCSCRCQLHGSKITEFPPNVSNECPKKPESLLGGSPQKFMAFLFEVIAGCFNSTNRDEQMNCLVSAAKVHLDIEVSKTLLSALRKDKE